MNTVRIKVRKCELTVIKIGLLLAITLLFLAISTGHFFYSVFPGYLLGTISFALLAEGHAMVKSLHGMTGKSLLLGNFKLLIFGLSVFCLVELGFSIYELTIGAIISQIAISFAFFLDSSP